MNRNDEPLKEIDTTIPMNDFPYISHFKKIGTIKANEPTESIVIKSKESSFESDKELVYLFVIDGYIQKVGSTTTTMKKRIQSYNCGKQAYRDSGTCSTTNYFVLQSFLRINKDIEVYAFFPEKKKMQVDVFGDIVEKELYVPSKEYEKKILVELKENGVMPILCTQT